MIVDIILILVFLVSLWIGWSIRIFIDWRRLLWLVLFGAFISVALPFFLDFVEQSSANLTHGFYYTIGIGMAALIFFYFYLLIRGKNGSSGVRRFVGSVVLAIVTFYSCVIVIWAMSNYGWLEVGDSLLFTHFSGWLLKPVD